MGSNPGRKLSLLSFAWDRFHAGDVLGRAPRTKETLPDFLKWSRVIQHPLVFRELTGSQRTPEFGASQYIYNQIKIFVFISTSSIFQILKYINYFS